MRAYTSLLPELPTSFFPSSMFRSAVLSCVPFLTAFLIHYISSNAYAEFCVPRSFFGVFQSLLLTGSPMCSALLSVMETTHKSYGVIIGGLLSLALYKLAAPVAAPAPAPA